MKKVFLSVITVFGLFLSTLAQETPTVPSHGGGGGGMIFNSLSLARGFLFSKTDHYVGDFWGETAAGKIHANFVMNKGMNITSLRINEEEIHLKIPLRGIPTGQLGPIQGFSLRLEARDYEQNARAFGHFDKNQLLASDHITIQLKPQGVKQFYPFDGNLGDVEVVAENFGDFFGWGPDHNKGGFNFKVDPDAQDVLIQLINRLTGEVLANLQIPSAFENAELVAEVPISVTLEGGVVEFDQERSDFHSLPFDGSAPWGDTFYPAKVFIGDLGDAGLSIAMRGSPISLVKVLRWTATGEMPEVPMNWASSTEEHDGETIHWTGVSQFRNLGRVIVVVYKTNLSAISWISFREAYYSPTTGEPLPTPRQRPPVFVEE